jgi:hypothetical protein
MTSDSSIRPREQREAGHRMLLGSIIKCGSDFCAAK